METKQKITLEELASIISAISKGELKRAKELVIKGCKSSPELMSFRLGYIMVNISSMSKHDEAMRFLRLFSNDRIGLDS